MGVNQLRLPLLPQVYLFFQHAVSNFDANFIMKADDDTFVNIPVLLHMLQQLSPERSYFMGHKMHRRTWWYASTHENTEHFICGYILSSQQCAHA